MAVTCTNGSALPRARASFIARPDVQHLLKPLVISWGYESETPSGSSFVDYYEWWGTRDIAAFLSVPAAIEFQRAHHWDAVRVACHELLVRALHGVTGITGLPSHYPNDSWYVQVAAASLPPMWTLRD